MASPMESAPSVRNASLRPGTAPRPRSFGGCYTCRTRHVKCDERLPTCRQCRRAGVICGGYVRNIIFDFELRTRDYENSGPTHFRRPLFTENERRRMSRWLISAVAPAATAKVLRLLDDDTEAMLEKGSRNINCTRGPFGAFTAGCHEEDKDVLSAKSTQQSPILCQPPDDPSYSARHIQRAGHDVDETSLEQSQGTWGSPPWPRCAMASTVDYENNEAFQVTSANTDVAKEVFPNYSLFGGRLPQVQVDMSGPFCDQVAANTAFAPGDGVRTQPTFENDFWGSTSETGERLLDTSPLPCVHDDLYLAAVRLPITIPNFMNTEQNPVLSHAIPLLKHYGSSVIASMSPFRHNNTPWHNMFLAQLKTCLASLTMGETLDEAGLTTFYGSLAISALSLGMTFQSHMWLEHAIEYQRQACTYARVVLTRPCIDLDADEYKSALIALLTMVQMSLFSGKQDQTEGFLLETEKLVRLRGLAKRKSRKIRLLHHCYVHMRLFHESTFVAAGCDESSHRREVRHAVESSGVTSSSDNLSFRLLHWNDLFREMAFMKGQIEGENDLHIARPGLFPSTMYPEIFGIPETFFFFWSQIIRLGNEKDLAERGGETEPTTLRDFSKRAKAIENGILQLQSTSLGRQENDALILTSLLDGMQSALRIYFYRRIYDVSSSMLQTMVVSVRNWLFNYDQANPDFLHGSFGLMWPAFIAACEADGAGLQDSFRHWFRNAARRSGLGCISESAKLVEKVWEARRVDDKNNVSWLDVISKCRARGAKSCSF